MAILVSRTMVDTPPKDTPSTSIAVPDLPPRVILDLATKCNLRCHMCPVWGADEEQTDTVKGVMALEKARKVLDEVMAAKPLIHPALYGEPTLAPSFKEIVRESKEKGFTVAINTNGLTISDDLAKFIIENVDSISVSIDSVTPETLQKIRGIDKLDKIEAAVHRLLEARGNRKAPRIGVSFTTQDDNKHELDAFVARWTPIVDVVRIGNIFKDGYFQGFEVPENRTPCNALYLTMPVHNDGTVTVCCLDSWRQTNMGNVFETSVKEVWQGEKFQEVRRLHEEGRWSEVPVCDKCNGWVQYLFDEEVRDGLLIRRSPEFTYYNRIDRLESWSGQLMGGHEPTTDLSQFDSTSDQ